MTYFRYGNYTHDNDEVVLTAMEVIPKYSDRGRRREATYRLHLVGELIGTGSTLQDKIAELITAYEPDDQDAALYLDDGTLTRHRLEANNSANLSGVHVAARSWPKGDAAEICTTRSFYIRLEATYFEPTSQIVWYQETVRSIGTTGPAWVAIPQVTGPVIFQQIAQVTPQIIIQAGTVTGLEGYPLGNVPPPLLPTYEHQEKRTYELLSPQFRGRRYSDFSIRWAYHMSSPTAQTLIPNVG